MRKGKFSQPRNSAEYIRSGQTPPHRKPQRKSRHRGWFFVVLLILSVVALAAVIAVRYDASFPFGGADTPPTETSIPTEAPTEAPTEPPNPIVSTASIAATGDVLMHMPVINACYDSGSGSYDFNGIFQYLSAYASQVDYAVANLETTLAGTANGRTYSGYPCFNAPDTVAEALVSAGFDMLLTSNNHCYDTRTDGLTRTLQVSHDLGLDTLGTQADAEDVDYHIEIINGIRVGMMCYSYATSDKYPDRPSMNGILVGTEATEMVNYFDYDRLDLFYDQVATAIAEMESAGAKATVMYIHWGNEYQLSANSYQTSIAQSLCDLGIDIIVGGHPHVVQPMELLTSTTDDSHKTVCLYSMGNAISNQRRNLMNLQTGHTEDGVLLSFSFTEYLDGEVLLSSVDILPTWVYLNSATSPKRYCILPLDSELDDWAAAFDISETVAASAMESYERTMALVGDGLTEIQTYLSDRNESKLAQITGGDIS